MSWPVEVVAGLAELSIMAGAGWLVGKRGNGRPPVAEHGKTQLVFAQVKHGVGLDEIITLITAALKTTRPD